MNERISELKSLDNILEAKQRGLVFEEEGKRIALVAEDGARVFLGQIFWREGDDLVIGELLYCHALIEDLNDVKSEPREAIIPVCLVAIYRGGQLAERYLKPYMLLKKVDLNGKPILIEARTRSSEPLNTLMSLDAGRKFINGGDVPTWRDAYNVVLASVRRFVNLDWDLRLYDVAVSWILATYFAEAFSAFSFLYLYGSPGSGKTRLLKTAVLLSRHGFVVTDPSEASLYRLAEAFRPTLGVDEGLLGSVAWRLIRAAFKRGSTVPRIEKTKKDEFIISLFEPYMPVAFSSTEMPKDLGGAEADESRAIFIFMKQMPDPIGRDPEPWDFHAERDISYLLRLGKAVDVVESFRIVESSGLPFKGHEREIWLPLLAVARLIGPEVFQNVLSYALELTGIKEMQQYQEEKAVIRAILLMYRAEYAEIIKFKKNERINSIEFTASELQSYIKSVLDNWGELDEHLFPKQWDSRKIGRILTRIGIFKREKAGKSHYIVTAKGLQDLYRRFFPVGLVGLVGLKTKVINPENNPTTPQEKAERSPDQASLTSYTADVGLNPGKITLEINPTDPTNPTREGRKQDAPKEGIADVGLSSEKMTFEINPTNPTDPTSLADLIQKVRLAFQGGSLEEFLNVAVSLGLSREEADSLLKILLKEARLALDPEGDLRWIK